MPSWGLTVRWTPLTLPEELRPGSRREGLSLAEESFSSTDRQGTWGLSRQRNRKYRSIEVQKHGLLYYFVTPAPLPFLLDSWIMWVMGSGTVWLLCSLKMVTDIHRLDPGPGTFLKILKVVKIWGPVIMAMRFLQKSYIHREETIWILVSSGWDVHELPLSANRKDKIITLSSNSDPKMAWKGVISSVRRHSDNLIPVVDLMLCYSSRPHCSMCMSPVRRWFCGSSCVPFPSPNQEYTKHSVRHPTERGFIRVHLNIHDSLHFGSKKTLVYLDKI